MFPAFVAGAGPSELAIVVAVGGLLLPLVALAHVLLRDDLEGTQRLVWALLVVFVPFLWLVYFLLGKERTAAIFDDL